jgi:hypothetical protein
MIAEGVPHSKFDVGRSMFDVHNQFLRSFFCSCQLMHAGQLFDNNHKNHEKNEGRRDRFQACGFAGGNES